MQLVALISMSYNVRLLAVTNKRYVIQKYSMPYRNYNLTDLRFVANLNVFARVCLQLNCYVCTYLEIDTRKISVILIIEKKKTIFLGEHTWNSSNESLAHDFPPDWAGKGIFSISLNLLKGLVIRAATFTQVYTMYILSYFKRNRQLKFSQHQFLFYNLKIILPLSHMQINKIWKFKMFLIRV